MKRKIIWADDEIELLKPHILFLEQRGYRVTPVTNGEDALHHIRKETYDIVLLDEMMPGKDGLTTLMEIKDMQPSLPVIMITKSEEEQLMEDAIGRKIDFYLTKPVNPSQILLAIKKILDARQITEERLSRDYIQEFNRIARRLAERLDYDDWIDIHLSLSQWDLELDSFSDPGLRQTLQDQRHECNMAFGKYIEDHYRDWLSQPIRQRPVLSPEVIPHFVFPKIAARKKIVFIVIDCLRMDQWLCFEPSLRPLFHIQRHFYYSILPTATPYARNAIFSGMYPLDIEKKFPEIWSKGEEDDSSRNRFEKELLDHLIARNRVPMEGNPRYIKVLTIEHARQLENNILSIVESSPLTAIVINFLDVLAHSRSDSTVIKEIAPDEAAYRSLSTSWFLHSSFYEILKRLAKTETTVIITSDHGSIRSLHDTQVIGDKETSTSLRYKYGKNIKANPKHAMFIRNPAEYKLPIRGLNTHYILAKEDYFFVYPTNYHYYLNYYKDSFQHGGISMEEMILPVLEMEGKKI